MQLDWSKTAKHFSVNSRGKFLSWHEARRRASKWISPLRQILFILLVSYFNNVCCNFHLGKMFIRILSIIFDIYCSLDPQLSFITARFSDSMFLSFDAIAIPSSFGWKWHFLAKKHYTIQKNIHNSSKTFDILLK